MPIALLLEESVLTFRFGAKQLDPWTHLVRIEELLIDRARSAFLVHWFGARLPLRRMHLQVVIQNLGEFRERFLQAVQSARGDISGPNILGPLAGLTGTLAGIVFSPAGIALTVIALSDNLSHWLVILLVVLAGLIGPPVILGLGIPLGLAAGLGVGAVGEEYTGAVIDVLGALANTLNSASGLMEQLLGPRDKIANPLVRQFLGLLDHLAGLVPQFLGFLAIVVTRFGPLLIPLVAQFNAFQELFAATLATIKFILNDLLERLGVFLDPQQRGAMLGKVLFVIEKVTSLLPALIDIFTEFFANTSKELKALKAGLIGRTSKEAAWATKTSGSAVAASGFSAFFETVIGWLGDAIQKSPLKLMIDAASKAFGEAGRVLAGTVKLHISGFEIKIGGGPKSAPAKSTFPDFPDIHVTSSDEVTRALGGQPTLDFDAIGPWSKKANELMEKRFHGVMPLDAAAEAQLDRFRNPPRIFVQERKRLEDAIGGAAQRILADRVAGQQQLRTLIYALVGRVLPPEVRPYLDQIGSAFNAFDALVLSKGATDEAHFPVRDIPDNGKIRTVIHRLVVKSEGGNRQDLQDFATRLSKALNQDYPAPEMASA